MKKLLLIAFTLLFIISCSKSDLLPETEPEPKEEAKTDVNFIRYLKGPNPDSIFTLPKYTQINFKAVYNINSNEISSYGFKAWHLVGKKINQTNWEIAKNIDLTKRTDTLKISTKLYEHFSEGDSAYLIIKLMSKKSDNSYAMLASDTSIFLIAK